MERGREADQETYRNYPFGIAADGRTDVRDASLRLSPDLRWLGRGDGAEWGVAGRGDLPDAVPGGCLERDALPLQSRLRDAGLGKSG